jgi:hypothetical protein
MLSALIFSSHSYKAASRTRRHAMWGSGDSTTMSQTFGSYDVMLLMGGLMGGSFGVLVGFGCLMTWKQLRRIFDPHLPSSSAPNAPPSKTDRQTDNPPPTRTHLLVRQHVPDAVRRQHHKLIAPGRQRHIRDLRVRGAADRRGHQITERSGEEEPRRGHLLEPHPRLPDEAAGRQTLRLHPRAGRLDTLPLREPPRAVVDGQRLRAPLGGPGRHPLAEDDAAVAGGGDPEAVAKLEGDGRGRAAAGQVDAGLRELGGGGAGGVGLVLACRLGVCRSWSSVGDGI